jgi:hypothetical protein
MREICLEQVAMGLCVKMNKRLKNLHFILLYSLKSHLHIGIFQAITIII